MCVCVYGCLHKYERKIDALGPIHVHVWASIVNAAVGSAATKEDADILKEHFDSITKPGSDPNSICAACTLLLAFVKLGIKER